LGGWGEGKENAVYMSDLNRKTSSSRRTVPGFFKKEPELNKRFGLPNHGVRGGVAEAQ